MDGPNDDPVSSPWWMDRNRFLSSPPPDGWDEQIECLHAHTLVTEQRTAAPQGPEGTDKAPPKSMEWRHLARDFGDDVLEARCSGSRMA